MSPCSSAVSTSDNLNPTVFNDGETVYQQSKNWRFFSAERLFAWDYTQLHLHAVTEHLCRRRFICIFSFAGTPAILIFMDATLCIPLKSKHSVLSPKRPLWTGPCGLSGGVIALWMGNWKPQPAISWIKLICVGNKLHSTTHLFHALINLFPIIPPPQNTLQYQEVSKHLDSETPLTMTGKPSYPHTF